MWWSSAENNKECILDPAHSYGERVRIENALREGGMVGGWGGSDTFALVFCGLSHFFLASFLISCLQPFQHFPFLDIISPFGAGFPAKLGRQNLGDSNNRLTIWPQIGGTHETP